MVSFSHLHWTTVGGDEVTAVVFEQLARSSVYCCLYGQPTTPGSNVGSEQLVEFIFEY